MGEIEAALMSHHAVKDAVMLAHKHKGPSTALTAYIVPESNGSDPGPGTNTFADPSFPNRSGLRTYLQEKLPGYMIPSAFVLLDSLSLTPNGKVDRRHLPASDRQSLLSQNFVTPGTATEKRLAAIWGDVLGLTQVGINDDFFDLGGHSLLVTQVIAHIRDTFRVDVPLQRLFETPTIAAVAGLIDQTQPTTEAVATSAVTMSAGRSLRQSTLSQPLPPHLISLQTEGIRPPLFLVHPVAGVVFPYYELALRLGAKQPIYGLQSVGIAGEAPPLTRIETMAETYLDAVRLVQPEGPYQLVGWSFGALVALEMAQHLARLGQSVAFLGIVDTPLYSSKLGMFWHGSRLLLTTILPHLWPDLRDYLSLRLAIAWPSPGHRSRSLHGLQASSGRSSRTQSGQARH